MQNTNTSNWSNDFARTNYRHKEQIIRCGVSSLKCFDGEDLNQGNRRRLQQLQQNDWIAQQTNENLYKKLDDRQENQAFAEQSQHINMMRGALEDEGIKKRREWERTTKEFNQLQMKEKFDRSRADHDESEQQKKTHINYCNTNNFQTENTATCKSTVSANRVIPYHWKGMNDEQKKDIVYEQEAQRKENDILRDVEKNKNAGYAQEMEQTRFMLVNLDRDRHRKHKQQMDQMREFNLLAANEQKLKLKHMYD